MPAVDANMQHMLGELKSLVDLRKEEQDKYPTRFPVAGEDAASLKALELLKGRLTAVLQLCSHARAKAQFEGRIDEASWRYDLDRLFFDFFMDVMDYQSAIADPRRAWVYGGIRNWDGLENSDGLVCIVLLHQPLQPLDHALIDSQLNPT